MTYIPLEQAFPVGDLKVAVLNNDDNLGKKLNKYLVATRHSFDKKNSKGEIFDFYTKDNYLLDFQIPRFGSGEGKAKLNESVRGTDLFILVDVLNSNQSYKINNEETLFSPDDNFQDLKRLIASCNGKTVRINVIMPFLYEGRIDNRENLESLDCANALHELVDMGVENIITFDAHEPRIENAIPLEGFDNFSPSLQFITTLLDYDKDLVINDATLMTASPDENGTKRAIYYANMLGVNTGMFYARRDYSKIVNGEAPIISYEFLGAPVEGKTVVIIDDMISSGVSLLETMQQLKLRKAKKVYVFATYGLFTRGYEEFDKAFEEGLFDQLFTTNLTYVDPVLSENEYYTEVDMSRYLATIINIINHDSTTEDVIDPSKRVQQVISNRKNILDK